MKDNNTIFVSSEILGERMLGTRKQFKAALKGIMKAWYAAYLANEAEERTDPDEPLMTFKAYVEYELDRALQPSWNFSEAELAEIPSL